MIEWKNLRMGKTGYWLKKSRVKWLKNEDGNITFFHKVASRRRFSNLITLVTFTLGLHECVPISNMKMCYRVFLPKVLSNQRLALG